MGDCVPSIAAALRACMPCPAAPPTRNWVLADRVSESRSQPGMTIDVKLSSVDARDSMGRIAHVRGIMVRAGGNFDVGQNQGSGAVSAFQLRGLFSALMLEDVTGHAFWPSLDARSILDDTFFRHYAQIQWPYLAVGAQLALLPVNQTPYAPQQLVDYGLAAAAAPASVSADIGWYAPLVTLGPGANPLAGLIPLAALQRQSSQGSFRFKLLTQIPGAPANITFTGVVNGEGNPGLDVWLDVVYLPVLAIDPSWTLDHYTQPFNSFVLRRPEESTEHAQIRFFPEDTPSDGTQGWTAVNALNTFTLKVAGYTIMDGLSIQDAIMRSLLFASSERDSALTRANAEQDLPWFDGTPQLFDQGNTNITAITLLPYRQRGTGEASGDVNLKIATDPLDYIRILQRTIECNERERANALAEAVGCDPCSRSVTCDTKGNPTQSALATSKGTILVMDPGANALAKGR